MLESGWGLTRAISETSLPSTVVETDKANTYGAFAQVFPSTQLQIGTSNPVIFSNSGLTASRTFTFPDLTDTLVSLTATQSLTNKTLTDASNTINATTAASPFAIGTNLSLSASGLTGVRTYTFPDSTDTVVTLAATQTLTGKTLSAPTLSGTVAGTPTIASAWTWSTAQTFPSPLTVGTNLVLSQTGLTGVRTFTFPDSTDTVVTLAATQTLTGKTISGGTISGTIAGTPTISSAWTWSTAQAFPNLTTVGTNVVISATGLTGVRTFTFPDLTDTLVTLTATQTLTNKTLTTPIISTISNTGTITLPTATDTLVARATTDTLTNKTFDGQS